MTGRLALNPDEMRQEFAKLGELPTVNLKRWGAVGDGVNDDSPVWQAALNAVAGGGRLLVPRPKVAYKLFSTCFLTNGTNVEIVGERGALFQLAPSCTFGLRFAGAASLVRVARLRFQGTGNVADAQRGIGEITAGSASGDDVLIEDNEVWNVTAGIFFDNGNLDSWHKVVVQRNKVHDILGIVSGTGYGIVFSTVNGGQISNNDLSDCQRHSIYQSAGERTQILANRIRRHRFGLGLSGLAAIQISRARQILAQGNILDQCDDVGCSIEPRETLALMDPSRNIQYVNNTHRNSLNAEVWVGTQSPATDQELSDVTVADNHFFRPADPTNLQIPVRVWSGKRIRVARNTTYAENAYTGTFANYYFPGANGEQYTDDLTVEDNTLAVSLGAGGTAILAEVSAVVAAGTRRVRLIDNKITCSAGVNFTPVSFDGALTNQNLEVKHPALVQTLAYAAAMTPNVEKGPYIRVTVTNGVAFTFNTPGNFSGTANLAIGAELELDILNSSGGAMGAVTFAAIYKLAGAFVAPANTKRRLYRFVYDGTNLVERYRSAADI